jgi:hypothetical protein
VHYRLSRIVGGWPSTSRTTSRHERVGGCSTYCQQQPTWNAPTGVSNVAGSTSMPVPQKWRRSNEHAAQAPIRTPPPRAGRTAKKLAAAGITSVGQLARADPADQAGRFGPTMGPWYRAVALCAGSTEVSAELYVARSRRRETTFQRDIVERAELDEQQVVLARRVA